MLLLLSVLFPSLSAVRTVIAHVDSEGRREIGRQFGTETEMRYAEHGEQSHVKKAVWGGRAFQHAGKDYYWDEHPGQCANQTICSVSIKELRKGKNYKRSEKRYAFPNEANTNHPTTLQTATVYLEDDVLKLKYSNGSEPQRIAWSCKSGEVCCKRECCYEDDWYYNRHFWKTNYGMAWAILGSFIGFIGIMCGFFWCCWGLYRYMRGARSFRESARHGAPLPVYGPVYPAYMGHNHLAYSAQPMGYSVRSIESREQRSQHALPKHKREVGTKESREKVSTINEEQEDH